MHKMGYKNPILLMDTTGGTRTIITLSRPENKRKGQRTFSTDY